MSRQLLCKLAAAAVLTIALAGAAVAQAPSLITIQGKLTDSSGTPLPAGDKDFTFEVFDSQAGGALIWTEDQTIANDAAGLWNTQLGAVNPLSTAVFDDSVRWLEITVDDGAIHTLPRVRLVTGPYAHRVSTVDGALGGTILTNVSIGTGHTNVGGAAFVAGSNHSAIGSFSSITGGTGNEVTGSYAIIGGGANNVARGFNSVVAGGGSVLEADSNSAGAHWSAVGGGMANHVEPDAVYGVIAGGQSNTAGDTGAVVSGGGMNNATGRRAFIGSGWDNDATAGLSVVVGGQANSAAGVYSFIGGGVDNEGAAFAGAIGGGQANMVGEAYSTVGGGLGNISNGAQTTVGGGSYNTAMGSNSTVAGGQTCIATGWAAAVGGGASDSATGDWATVPGGRYNKAAGVYSFAAGYRAKAIHNGSYVWGDGQDADIASHTTNQYKLRAQNGVHFASQAGAAKFIGIGDHYKDNGIVAWAKVAADGTLQGEFGITSVAHVAASGVYRVTVNAIAESAVTLIPLAQAEVEAIPTSAASARLTTINQDGTNVFEVYITNGNYVAVDNDFVLIVTAR